MSNETKHTTIFDIGEDGIVFSLSRWRSRELRKRVLVAHQNSKGYLRIRVFQNGKRVSLFVHKMVAAKYLPARPTPQHEIRHLNGNKLDNRAANLCWGTRKDNAADRELHGHTSRGEKHGNAIKAGLAARQ
jgi:HNH endonuclease